MVNPCKTLATTRACGWFLKIWVGALSPTRGFKCNSLKTRVLAGRGAGHPNSPPFRTFPWRFFSLLPTSTTHHSTHNREVECSNHFATALPRPIFSIFLIDLLLLRASTPIVFYRSRASGHIHFAEIRYNDS
jgi:hypothetical protein